MTKYSKKLNSYAQTQILSQNDLQEPPPSAIHRTSRGPSLQEGESPELIQRCIIIKKDHKGYGLTVSGDNPVYVQSVRKDGAADRAGVNEGDRIIKVNGNLVTHANHLEVVRLIKAASYVALTLFGRPPGPKREDSNDRLSAPTDNENVCSTLHMASDLPEHSTCVVVSASPSSGGGGGGSNGRAGPGINYAPFLVPHPSGIDPDDPAGYAPSNSSSDPYKCQAIGDKINTLKNLFNQEAIILRNLQKQYLYNPSYKLKQEINSVTRRLSALNENISNLSKMVHSLMSTPMGSDAHSLHGYKKSSIPSSSAPYASHSFDEGAVMVRKEQHTRSWPVPYNYGSSKEYEQGLPSPPIFSKNATSHMVERKRLGGSFLSQQSSAPSFSTAVSDQAPIGGYKVLQGRPGLDLTHHRRSTGSVSSLLESSLIDNNASPSFYHPVLDFEQSYIEPPASSRGGGSRLHESIGNGMGSVTVLNNIYTSATLLKRNENPQSWVERVGGGVRPLHSSIPNLNSSSNIHDKNTFGNIYQPINVLSMEDDDTQSDNENLEDHGPFNDIHSLKNHPAHLAVFLNYLFCNSDPNTLLFYLITDYYMHSGLGKDLRRWAYEIHSSFIVPNAPLKIAVTEYIINSIDESLQNDCDKEEVMKFIFRPARRHILVDIREKLSDFRLKRTLGLSSIYGDSPLLDECHTDKSKMIKMAEQVMTSIVEKFINYWKEDPSFEGICDKNSLLLASLLTISRQMGIKSSTLGGATLFSAMYERIPLFCAKEKSRFKFVTGGSKRSKERNIKGHLFNTFHYTSLTFCNFCHDIMCGIGTQGYQCQNCEYNAHKQCLDQIDECCVGVTRRREKKLSGGGTGVSDRNSLSTKSFMNNIIKRRGDVKSIINSSTGTNANPPNSSQVPLPTYTPSHYAIEKTKRLLDDNTDSVDDSNNPNSHITNKGDKIDKSGNSTTVHHTGHPLIGAIKEDSFEEDDDHPDAPLSRLSSIDDHNISGGKHYNNRQPSSKAGRQTHFSTSFDQCQIVVSQHDGTCDSKISNNGAYNPTNLIKSGSFSSAPPVISTTCTGQNLTKPLVSHGVEGSSGSGKSGSSHKLPYIRSFNYHPTSNSGNANGVGTVSTGVSSFFQKSQAQNWFSNRLSSGDSGPAASEASKTAASALVGRSESMKAKGENKYPRKKSDPNVPRSKSDIAHKAASSEQVTDIPDIPQPSVARVLIKRTLDDVAHHALKRSVPKSDSLLSHSSATSNQSSSTFPYLDYGSDFYDSDLDIEPEVPNWQKKIDWEHLKKMKPKEVMRQDVINELFHTEKNHVRNLKVLDYIFYKPLKKDNLIPPDLLHSLFPNLEHLLKIHGELNEQMKAKRAQGLIIDSVGPMLLNFFGDGSGESFQQVCATFCQSQFFALESLKMRQKKDPKLASFLNEAEANVLCRRLQLKDLIPCQMQRLTKYPLLIENIMKYTTPDGDEYTDLSQAYKSARLILDHVNESVRETENFHRLLNVESRLDKGPLEKAFERAHDPRAVELRHLDLTKKKLVMDGPLIWRFSRTKNIEVHALLLEDLLLIMQKQDEKFILKFQSTSLAPGKEDGKLSHSPVIKLSNLLTKNVATDKRAFFLVSTLNEGPQLYELIASTSNERKIWLKNIEKAVEKLKSLDTSISANLTNKTAEEKITVMRHSSNPNTKSEMASATVALSETSSGIDSKSDESCNIQEPIGELKESMSQPLIKDLIEPIDTKVTLDADKEHDIKRDNEWDEPSVPRNLDEGLSPSDNINEGEEDNGEELVEYIKTAQIILPSEVVISEPLKSQRAEPILTLYEQLKRADHMLARALKRKQNIIQDILLEKLEERRMKSSVRINDSRDISHDGDAENNNDAGNGAFGKDIILEELNRDKYADDNDPKSVLLSALQQARKLERFVAQFEAICSNEDRPLLDSIIALSPPPPSYLTTPAAERGMISRDSAFVHEELREMRDALLTISTHLNVELSRLMELFCEREKDRDYAEILDLRKHLDDYIGDTAANDDIERLEMRTGYFDDPAIADRPNFDSLYANSPHLTYRPNTEESYVDFGYVMKDPSKISLIEPDPDYERDIINDGANATVLPNHLPPAASEPALTDIYDPEKGITIAVDSYSTPLQSPGAVDEMTLPVPAEATCDHAPQSELASVISTAHPPIVVEDDRVPEQFVPLDDTSKCGNENAPILFPTTLIDESDNNHPCEKSDERLVLNNHTTCSPHPDTLSIDPNHSKRKRNRKMPQQLENILNNSANP